MAPVVVIEEDVNPVGFPQVATLGALHPLEVAKEALDPPTANRALSLVFWPVVNIYIQASFV